MTARDILDAGWISYLTAAVLSAGITLVALPDEPYWQTVALATFLFGSLIWATVPLILTLSRRPDEH